MICSRSTESGSQWKIRCSTECLKNCKATKDHKHGAELKIIAVFIGFLLLPGCAAYEQQHAAERQAEFQAIQQNEDAQCRSYGAEPGSAAYVNCRTQLSGQRAADESQRRAVVGAYLLNRR
jgi:hypothetical protein